MRNRTGASSWTLSLVFLRLVQLEGCHVVSFRQCPPWEPFHVYAFCLHLCWSMLNGMLKNAGEAKEAEELLLCSQFHSAVIFIIDAQNNS